MPTLHSKYCKYPASNYPLSTRVLCIKEASSIGELPHDYLRKFCTIVSGGNFDGVNTTYTKGKRCCSDLLPVKYK